MKRLQTELMELPYRPLWNARDQNIQEATKDETANDGQA